MSKGWRIALFLGICAAGAALSVFYVVRRSPGVASSSTPGPSPAVSAPKPARADPGSETSSNVLGSNPAGPRATLETHVVRPADETRLFFRNTKLGENYGAMGIVQHGKAPSFHRTLPCERVHFSAGTGVCLVADRGFWTSYAALIFDEKLAVRHRLNLIGAPSRTRVAPNGKLAAITVFVTGHSYADTGFSTQTTIVDTMTGRVLGELEQISVIRGDKEWKQPDFNFWGVTFAADSDRFYATLTSGGRTYLVKGSLNERQATIVREAVECPSLSPDNSRIAFKKVIQEPYRHWIISVLDLTTMTETVLAEERNVDDQVEWLDDRRILYGLPEDQNSAVVNTWMIDRIGHAQPRLFLAGAASVAIDRMR